MAGTVLTFVDITRLKQVEASLRGVVESLQLKVEASLEDVHEAMEQRQALHQLARESLQKYHALFDRIPLAIVVFDSTYRVCEANARADRLFGCAAGGLVVAGALPDDRHFVGIDGAAIDLPGLVRAAGSAPSASPYIELQLLAGGGERRWLTATTARLELPAGGMAVVFDDLTEQRQAEADYGTLFAQMLDSFADHEVLCDEHGEPCNLRLVSANPAFERINGISLAEATGRTLSQGWPSLEPYWADACLQVARTGQAVEFETWSEVLDKYLLVRAYRPAPRHVACICSDITRRKRAELEEQRLQVQLSQAQKMESIGRLAGGVAHDFNNLLTVINGYSQLLLESSEPGGPDHTALAAIQHAGEAAAGLTRELLAFSRRQVLDMKGLNLHEVIENIAPMLVRMLGEDVEVRFMLHAPRPFVLSDQHQLERVLLNLAVNARDAMPHGGTLSVSTTEVATLPRQSELLPAGASEGPYVLLTCADNGVGMSDDTRQHIFEPFFTTKEMGRGTGLGLAMGARRCGAVRGRDQRRIDARQGHDFPPLFPAGRRTGTAGCAGDSDCAAPGRRDHTAGRRRRRRPRIRRGGAERAGLSGSRRRGRRDGSGSGLRRKRAGPPLADRCGDAAVEWPRPGRAHEVEAPGAADPVHVGLCQPHDGAAGTAGSGRGFHPEAVPDSRAGGEDPRGDSAAAGAGGGAFSGGLRRAGRTRSSGGQDAGGSGEYRPGEEQCAYGATAVGLASLETTVSRQSASATPAALARKSNGS